MKTHHKRFNSLSESKITPLHFFSSIVAHTPTMPPIPSCFTQDTAINISHSPEEDVVPDASLNMEARPHFQSLVLILQIVYFFTLFQSLWKIEVDIRLSIVWSQDINHDSRSASSSPPPAPLVLNNLDQETDRSSDSPSNGADEEVVNSTTNLTQVPVARSYSTISSRPSTPYPRPMVDMDTSPEPLPNNSQELATSSSLHHDSSDRPEWLRQRQNLSYGDEAGPSI